MNSFAQLRRQPLKSFSGVILIALAVAILCVCVGQAAAAANMRTAMEKSYKTVALPTNRFLLDADPQQVWDWTQRLLEENPDVILEDSRIGLASAWIEGLSSDNYVSYLRSDKATNDRNAPFVSDPRGAPYTCAMLEVEVSAIHTESETMLLEGKVTQVIALADNGCAHTSGNSSDHTTHNGTLPLKSNNQLKQSYCRIVYIFCIHSS